MPSRARARNFAALILSSNSDTGKHGFAPKPEALRNKPATAIPDKRHTKRNKSERKRDAERAERDRD